jgi:hypothetical protein
MNFSTKSFWKRVYRYTLSANLQDDLNRYGDQQQCCKLTIKPSAPPKRQLIMLKKIPSPFARVSFHPRIGSRNTANGALIRMWAAYFRAAGKTSRLRSIEGLEGRNARSASLRPMKKQAGPAVKAPARNMINSIRN